MVRKIEVCFSQTEQPECRLAGDFPPCCHSGTQVPSVLLFHNPLWWPLSAWSKLDWEYTHIWIPRIIKSVEESHPFLKVPAHKWLISLLLTFCYSELIHVIILATRGRAGKYLCEQPYAPQFSYYKRKKEWILRLYHYTNLHVAPNHQIDDLHLY